jgi:RND family efflux transporter MFP subunit
MRAVFTKCVWATSMLATLVFITDLSGCNKQAPQQQAANAVPVDVVVAEQRDVPVFGDWVATTDGFVNAQVQPQVSGYLMQQTYKEGSLVHKDQILFEIDERPFDAALDQAKGNLAQAKAQAELAEINVQRDTPLVQARAIARSQLDTEVQQLSAAKALIATNEAQVRQAELNVGFTKVRSLIDGIAGQAQTQVGNLVGPQTVLTSVSQVDPIKVFFPISEQEYLGLSKRARESGSHDLLTAGNSIPLQLTLSNGEVYPHKGRIVFVDRGVDPQTGSIRIAAAFANPGNILRPGQFGRIKAQTAISRSAIVIPQRCVSEMQGNMQVALVSPENKVSIRNVKLGPQVGSLIVIESGLREGDRVVSEGLGKLRDGSPVVPQVKAFANADAASPGRGK